MRVMLKHLHHLYVRLMDSLSYLQQPDYERIYEYGVVSSNLKIHYSESLLKSHQQSFITQVSSEFFIASSSGVR